MTFIYCNTQDLINRLVDIDKTGRLGEILHTIAVVYTVQDGFEYTTSIGVDELLIFYFFIF